MTFAENHEKFPEFCHKMAIEAIKSSSSFGLLLFQVQSDD